MENVSDASGQEPGSAEVQPTVLDQGSTEGGTDIFSGLDTDSLKYAETNGITDMGSALTKSRELEKLVGNSVRIPGDDASSDDIKSFLEKAVKPFVPETVDGYDFAMPENMPENMAYDGDMANLMKEMMLESGVTSQQAQLFHDQFVSKIMIPQHEGGIEQAQKQVDTANSAMEKAWGSKDSQEFKAGVEHVLRAVNELGGDEYKQALIAAGAIDGENRILNADLLIPLANISKQFLSEDTLVNGDDVSVNPFAEETKDWTERSRLVSEVREGKRDPQTVIALIKQAGLDPKTYGLNQA